MRIRAQAILLFLLLCGAPSSAHPPVQLTLQGEQGVVEDIHAFRKAMAAAVAAKDAAKLRDMYAESFTHTHTSSKMDGKDARIVSLLSGDPVIELAPAEDLRIRVLAGGWVAIATAVSPIKSLADGKTYSVHWTATYVVNEQKWQLAASHATRGKEVVK